MVEIEIWSEVFRSDIKKPGAIANQRQTRERLLAACEQESKKFQAAMTRRKK